MSDPESCGIRSPGSEFEMKPRVEEYEDFDFETSLPVIEKDDFKFCGNEKPFEELMTEMTPLTEDKKVMKKVIKDGKDQITGDGTIFFHYNCFTDGFWLPFDSSIMRSDKPTRLRFGRDPILDGLECSLRSMRVGETSQFLIHHERAFGELGMPGRIPTSATVLAEIHVVRFVESEVNDEEPVEMEDKTDFKANYLKARSLCDEAGVYFACADFPQSVSLYRKAESLLWDIRLKNDEEEEKMKKLLVKIYINLMVNFSKLRSPKKVCICCREAFEVSDEARLNPKLYYNLGKAYIELLNFPRAIKTLRKAIKLKPGNKDILNLINLARRQLEVSRPRNSNVQDYSDESSGFGDKTIDTTDGSINLENQNQIDYEETSEIGNEESLWDDDDDIPDYEL